ncbi:hypothetical protein [Paenibacillus sp. MMS18-CY102]|uniref:hypothetical protein n=1 Tax=Paenibacillus sp. MMS18-CY102 TaxID=2682849 RepID=UPI001365CBBD|nr:hypothetical protein [Paenibacillus sp. MMS18-CY102]MWC26627.1 hypothetical protein [Paenibacillus sp. MMS18-CY102]
MKNWAVEVAKMFKERNNPAASGATVATVLSPLPAISLSLTDEIVLDAEDVILSSRIGELSLAAGDLVIVLPSEGGQIYFVLDKVG